MQPSPRDPASRRHPIRTRRSGLVSVSAFVALVPLVALLCGLLPSGSASARVMPPDTGLIAALDAARPSFERCALDSELPETAFHTLSLRIITANRRASEVHWGQPFIGPTADRLLTCMRTIVRVALRPRRVHTRASATFYYVPLRDLDYPMQPPPSPPTRVMSAAEAAALTQRLAAVASDAERVALIAAQEEARVAVPVDAVASLLETFHEPDLAAGGALCRVVSGSRALARITRGLPAPDARRLRALTRGRCGVSVE